MGQIKVEKNVGGIQGLCVIEPTVHGDSRGYFMETYNENDMKEAGLDMVFVQPVLFDQGSSAWTAFSEIISTGQAGSCNQRFCL